MRTVPPVATAALEDRAFFARAWAGGWVIALEGGDVLVLDVDLRVRARVAADRRPDDVTLDRTGSVLVRASRQGLSAIALDRGDAVWRAQGHFLGCDVVGDRLWSAEAHGREVELAVRGVATGEVRCAVRTADPFGGSAVMFVAPPDERSTIAWLAAGQDGQLALLATHDGATIDVVEIGPRNRLPPVFAADGRTYLSAGDEVLERYAWPSGACLGRTPWPFAGDDDEDGPGSDVQLLPGGHATWSSTNGRIYLVELGAMRVVGELVIGGHPLRTVEDVFPELRGERAPCTDFEYAEPGPDGMILSVHAQSQLVVTRSRDWSPAPSRVLESP
ncbi:MAG: hypothetical protein F9K40_07825 [Kofleriaceae bacterium]|nr:MAG: hypothetical protein F9K40_07825 [Kofleriaceae bacterium]MBZ0237136.1 hypothetical protein [Kofleriaceae bacterium]